MRNRRAMKAMKTRRSPSITPSSLWLLTRATMRLSSKLLPTPSASRNGLRLLNKFVSYRYLWKMCMNKYQVQICTSSIRLTRILTKRFTVTISDRKIRRLPLNRPRRLRAPESRPNHPESMRLSKRLPNRRQRRSRRVSKSRRFPLWRRNNHLWIKRKLSEWNRLLLVQSFLCIVGLLLTFFPSVHKFVE